MYHRLASFARAIYKIVLMKVHDVCSFSDILLHQKWQTALQLYLHYRLPFS
ncbi:hypothetical protein RUMLAC_01488 [[Ruminococcus] lactaris ATCC 29176]|uniref:Uncharacterized protein n=1 Tax=[Ruminococcus] lactaris ATCC 29176 TaxID=471875 RepID=B5CPU4_9FIRM|nr:hypothetical protein RUMLAC_01488 [[Ruminococcus] lactaris ATCC 29176]